MELVCTEEHQQVDLVDLDKGDVVRTGVKHKLTVRSELADSQRQVIRNEHERAILQKSTRTIKTLNPTITTGSQRKATINGSISKKTNAIMNEQLAKEATSAPNSATMEMNLQNRLVHLLILKPLTLTLLSQRLKASNADLQPLLETNAWLDPISTCYSLRKESAGMIKTRLWPHYSARERQIVADNVLKLQMTGEYDALPKSSQAPLTTEGSNSITGAARKPTVHGVKGRIQKVMSRIRK